MSGPAGPDPRIEVRPPLDADHPAMPFMSAVVSQLTRGTDVDDAESTQRAEVLADLIAATLLAVESGDTERALVDLASDPALLSVFFQNVDLLYSHSYDHADALSVLTLEAIYRAVEAGGSE